MLLTFFLILFFIAYAILDRSEIVLSMSATKILLPLFYGSAVVALISIYLCTQEIYFVSDFLNKTVIWYPILLAGILLSIGGKQVKSIFHKVSLYTFMIFGFAILMTAVIPFVGLSISAYFTTPPGDVYYSDDNILVQDSFNGILSKPYVPDVYRKKYKIFVVQETSMMPCPFEKNVTVKVRTKQDYYEVIYFNEEGSETCSTRLMKE